LAYVPSAEVFVFWPPKDRVSIPGIEIPAFKSLILTLAPKSFMDATCQLNVADAPPGFPLTDAVALVCKASISSNFSPNRVTIIFATPAREVLTKTPVVKLGVTLLFESIASTFNANI
jgi:hypothetical protein